MGLGLRGRCEQFVFSRYGPPRNDRSCTAEPEQTSTPFVDTRVIVNYEEKFRASVPSRRLGSVGTAARARVARKEGD